MKLRFTAILFSIVFSVQMYAQELNCQVNINTEQIQGSTNKQIFEQMKKAVFEFMNNTKWTNEIYSTQEKIEASLLIIVKDVVGTDEYMGSLQVSCRRPVYKSAYFTQILNVEDE